MFFGIYLHGGNMKKLLITIILAAMIFTCVVPSVAYADSETGYDGKAMILMDTASKTVVFEKDADKHLPIASMVKIMTALLSFEAIDDGKIDFNQKVTISNNASSMGGSQMFLEEGDEYTVSDLLKGVIVVSANDACVALAETISGSTNEFVKQMNARAKTLGLKDTNFVNVTGLPAPEQYSCAYDVAIMLRELILHKEYYNYSKIWIEDYTHPDGRVTQFVNTNKLIRFNKDCQGGKTGFTNEAMFCLAASAERDGMNVIAVVIGASTSKGRFATVTSLFNKAFTEYENVKILDKNLPLEFKIGVKDSKVKEIIVYPEASYSLFSKKGEGAKPDISYEYGKVTAPVKKGAVVGQVSLTLNGEIKTINLLAGENADKMSYSDVIGEIADKW